MGQAEITVSLDLFNQLPPLKYLCDSAHINIHGDLAPHGRLRRHRESWGSSTTDSNHFLLDPGHVSDPLAVLVSNLFQGATLQQTEEG